MRLLVLLLAVAALSEKQPVQLADLPDGFNPILASAGAADAGGFQRLRERIAASTAERLREGEDEHLTYFVLQSNAFTARRPVEPALSAREFTDGLPVKERSRFLDDGSSCPPGYLPPDVRLRMQDFLDALRRPARDERLNYFRSHLPAGRRNLVSMAEAYQTAMRFLFRKEFSNRPLETSALYQQRGHSTDTQVEATFAIHAALEVLRALEPRTRVNRVLIVGPGLDFAPRTAFHHQLPPQSFQPYLTMDSLLRLNLTDADMLAIDCVDINPRVIRFIEDFPGRSVPTLTLPPVTGGIDLQEYVAAAGRAIGDVSEQPPGRRIRVSRKLARRVRAGQANIVLERYHPSPGYDLVIATNVLLYFNPIELALALANIHSMLRPGGYLVHNELRPELEQLARGLKLPPIQGRSLRVAAGSGEPLMDAFILHRKE